MSDRHKLGYYIAFGLGLALMIAALYMVFMYAPKEQHMGVVQRIFYFHVPLAWVGFLALLITFVFSILYLQKRATKYDTIAYASAEVGVVFITLVLVTGSLWAKSVWGIWWTWDARLTTALVLWLSYVTYFLVRGYATEPAQGARFSAVIGIVGFINVPIVFLTVNLLRTQHPTTIVFQGGLTSPMIATLLVCIAAFTMLYYLLLVQSAKLRVMEADVKYLRGMQAE